MTTKLKFLTIAVCCFIVTLCSTAQSSLVEEIDAQRPSTMQIASEFIDAFKYSGISDVGTSLQKGISSTNDYLNLAIEKPVVAVTGAALTFTWALMTVQDILTGSAVAAQPNHNYQCFCGNIGPNHCGAENYCLQKGSIVSSM